MKNNHNKTRKLNYEQYKWQLQTHKRSESNLWTILKTEFKFWKVKWVGRLTLSFWDTAGFLLRPCEPAQGQLTSLFTLWIHLLELFINLIRNAYVFANTIGFETLTKYWSEFVFFVLLQLFFHIFTFLKSKQFQSEPAHLSLKKRIFTEKWAGPRQDPVWKVEKFLQLEKKSFLLKNIFFLFVL